jgi:hypothetical protein
MGAICAVRAALGSLQEVVEQKLRPHFADFQFQFFPEISTERRDDVRDLFPGQFDGHELAPL